MPSFSKLSHFPAGYFRAFARWLLNNRRDLVDVVQTLDAEIARIGFLRVYYRAVDEGSGNVRVTEERVGFSVSEKSSLSKLLQAYIAQGGNPYDISPFKYPDTHRLVSVDGNGTPTLVYTYPEGGVLAPKSVEPNSPVGEPGTGYGAYQGGWLKSDRYYPARMGGRLSRGQWDADTVVRSMSQMRGWANQMIKERLQDIEWRIVKLCDLREQLTIERDETIAQAFAGSLHGLPDFDPNLYNRGLLVQNLIQDMNQLIFETSGEKVTYSAPLETGFLYFVFPDKSSEVRDPLGC